MGLSYPLLLRLNMLQLDFVAFAVLLCLTYSSSSSSVVFPPNCEHVHRKIYHATWVFAVVNYGKIG